MLVDAKISIDGLSHWVWRCTTSFIDYTIQIYVSQKDLENQWGAERISSCYITVSSRNINIIAVLRH